MLYLSLCTMPALHESRRFIGPLTLHEDATRDLTKSAAKVTNCKQIAKYLLQFIRI